MLSSPNNHLNYMQCIEIQRYIVVNISSIIGSWMMTIEQMEDMKRRIDEMREACKRAGDQARRKDEGVRDGG